MLPMANRKRSFTTRCSYAVLARMDELSDDDSFSDFQCSSDEELLDDNSFDIPGKLFI